MGHQDQDGEKVGQMSLFDQKLEAATDREKQKFMHFQVLKHSTLGVGVHPILRLKAKNWMFDTPPAKIR